MLNKLSNGTTEETAISAMISCGRSMAASLQLKTTHRGFRSCTDRCGGHWSVRFPCEIIYEVQNDEIIIYAIYNHNVDEAEVEQVLANPDEDRPGTGNSRVAIGHTDGGRILRVIYVRDPAPDSVCLITPPNLSSQHIK